MIKESIHQEDKTSNPKYVGTNYIAPKYIKQKLTTESKIGKLQLYLDVSTLPSVMTAQVDRKIRKIQMT